MPIILDHQLREYIPHNQTEFPITYFHDELVTLPNWAGPLHWHPDFEIATAKAFKRPLIMCVKLFDFPFSEASGNNSYCKRTDQIIPKGTILAIP